MKIEKWKVNGIELNVSQIGDDNGTPVILLHGFPENSAVMIESFKALTQSGHRLIAPDQRGYNLSSKPTNISDYSLKNLAHDIEELILKMKLPKVILIGHDWGAMVAWYLTSRKPEMIEKLIILNAPHYNVFIKNLLLNPFQIFRSYYIFMIHIPFFAEWLLSTGNFAVFKFMLRRSGHPAIEKLEASWKQPRTLTSMLNWYRAMIYSLRLPYRKIQVPTLIIWGEDDEYLQNKMAEQSLRFCAHGKLALIKGAGHWTHHQRQEEVISLITHF